MGGRGGLWGLLGGDSAGHWGGRGADRSKGAGVLEVWPARQDRDLGVNGGARWDRCAWLGCLEGEP